LKLLTTLHFLSAFPEGVSVDCGFTYNSRDSFAIRLDILVTPEASITWVVGRDLLIIGTDHLSGDGDVKVWPWRSPNDRPVLFLRLQRPGCKATFTGDLTVIRRWLDDTYDLVPVGGEDALLPPV
jgi:hypothetical protein